MQVETKVMLGIVVLDGMAAKCKRWFIRMIGPSNTRIVSPMCLLAFEARLRLKMLQIR